MNYLDRLEGCPLCFNPLELTDVAGNKKRQACTSQSCDFVFWKNPLPTAIAVIPYGGGIVLVKRGNEPGEPAPNTWCLPGGYVDTGESPDQAVVREVREETGLVVKVRQQFGLAITTPSNHMLTCFLVDVVGGELTAGDDAADIGVFSENTLPHNISFTHHEDKINQYFATQKATVKSNSCNVEPIFIAILLALYALFAIAFHFALAH